MRARARQGELVAQEFYQHLGELTMIESAEWSGDDLPGTVFYDSNPGESDDDDSGGTIGERLGW